MSTRRLAVVNAWAPRVVDGDLGAVLDLPEAVPGPLSVEDGYAIQDALVALRTFDGGRPAGYKVFLSRADLQEQFAATEPAYARLFPSMIVESPHVVSLERVPWALVEAEIAFVMGESAPYLRPDASSADICAATAYIAPSLEIPSMGQMWKNQVGNMLADNGGSVLAVVGATRAPAAELEETAVQLFVDGVQVQEGSTRNVLDHPLNVMKWLVAKLHSHGKFLAPGDLVLTGTCTVPHQAARGQRVRADFGALGSAEASFV